jgi:mannose-6-phosphate isomerase-like protein (cupin superfamily)
MPKKIALVVACIWLTPLQAADPLRPVFWSASQLRDIDRKIASNVDPARHLGLERLLDSATVIHRTGPSEAEVHQKLADFIVVRSGEGSVLVGGTIVEGRSSAPDELRGKAIDGGVRYTLAAGDTIYIPSNTVHQFFVESGKTFTATIVKITPKPQS